MLNNELKKYLEKLDCKQEALQSSNGEYKIAEDIKNILKKNVLSTPSKEDIAEQMAFDFMENYPDKDIGWETYYGPMYILPNEKGEMMEYPSIKIIDKKIIEYWEERARETKNPILSSRYADLTVDFSPKISKKNADVILFQIAIDSNITICKKLIMSPLKCKTKIKRALSLAIQINDLKKIIEIKNTILALEKNIATDEKPGLWGFTFKWLLLDFAKQINLNEKEKEKIINNIEERLKRIKDNSWLTEKAISLLAEYYAKEKDVKNLMRVLHIFEDSIKASKQSNSDGLLKIHAYEQIHEIYRKYSNRFIEAGKESKRLLQEIGKLDLEWDKSLKQISIDTNIKQKDIDSYLENIFGKNKDEKLEIIIGKIAIAHLPKKDDVKKQLNDISSKFPMQFLCTKQIIPENGIPIAKLFGLEEDYDNNFKSYALQYIQFGSFLLSLTTDELKKQFTKEKIIEYFEKSVIFENENKEYLKRAISAYWDNDYLVSSHLFCPLIESGIRELIKNCGGIVLKPNELNGYDNVLLGGLLQNDEIFNSVFSKIGHNILFYFKLVLSEKLGMNLRNDFAHGLGKKKFFNRYASDRLFHILIWLFFFTKPFFRFINYLIAWRMKVNRQSFF